nr:tetratricopeptide repeat protein [uncultured Pseudomonas sp.]
MSLVNDMLRDLEQRRAAPTERLHLDGLYAVDEAAAARRERIERIRRGSIWFMAVMLIAVLVGLMIGKVVRTYGPLKPDAVVASESVTAVPAQAPVPAPVPAPAQLLEVLPQHDSRGLVLQLLLDRAVGYQRTEESGAVSLRLNGVRMDGEAQRGQMRRDGNSLSWRVEPRGDDVQILLVGLADSLVVHDRLEPAGDRWVLWIEVPLGAGQAEVEAPQEPLPVATTPFDPEVEVPAWLNQPVARADAPPAQAIAAAPAAAAPERIPGPPQVKIEPYQADPLTLARQALQDGDYPGAIRQLEALQASRGDDPQVIRWLARAYLGGGEQARLLEWLPGRLALMPDDSELRLLLGRAQLQAGDNQGAIATLERNAPPIVREPTYHALLAAAYQQTGQWRESAALYQRLSELQPRQATWQLGLAIALEQLDQPAAAVSHYRLAQQGAGLDDSSRRFASERAAALGGR